MAVSGTSTASGSTAISGAGNAYGRPASYLVLVDSPGVSLSGAGGAYGGAVAVAGGSAASGGGVGAIAATGDSDANGGLVSVSVLGHARDGNVNYGGSGAG